MITIEPHHRLNAILGFVPARLSEFTEEQSLWRYGPGKWSKKELLGHLIDSAANNHQRFVRLSIETEVRFPPYAQNEWVGEQDYHGEPWGAIIALWEAYNRHLVHLMARLPEDRLDRKLYCEDREPRTLAWLTTDYLDHMEHHLRQLFDYIPAEGFDTGRRYGQT